jgi:hypothetical protein
MPGKHHALCHLTSQRVRRCLGWTRRVWSGDIGLGRRWKEHRFARLHARRSRRGRVRLRRDHGGSVFRVCTGRQRGRVGRRRYGGLGCGDGPVGTNTNASDIRLEHLELAQNVFVEPDGETCVLQQSQRHVLVGLARVRTQSRMQVRRDGLQSVRERFFKRVGLNRRQRDPARCGLHRPSR